MAVWLVAAPVQLIVNGRLLLAAIERKMRGSVWLDSRGNIRSERAILERVITAAMRGAGVDAQMRRKTFRKD
jgi:hypothetical protein